MSGEGPSHGPPGMSLILGESGSPGTPECENAPGGFITPGAFFATGVRSGPCRLTRSQMCASIFSSKTGFGIAPTIRSTTSPSLKKRTVGIERIP